MFPWARGKKFLRAGLSTGALTLLFLVNDRQILLPGSEYHDTQSNQSSTLDIGL